MWQAGRSGPRNGAGTWMPPKVCISWGHQPNRTFGKGGAGLVAPRSEDPLYISTTKAFSFFFFFLCFGWWGPGRLFFTCAAAPVGVSSVSTCRATALRVPLLVCPRQSLTTPSRFMPTHAPLSLVPPIPPGSCLVRAGPRPRLFLRSSRPLAQNGFIAFAFLSLLSTHCPRSVSRPLCPQFRRSG